MLIIYGEVSRNLKRGGAIALACPWCAEITVADQFVLTRAHHIYFLEGIPKEVSKYVRCRLCAMPSELPNGAAPSREPLKHPHDVLASEAFIAKTNQKISRAEKTELAPLPDNIPRTEAAFFQAVLHLKRQSSTKGQELLAIGCLASLGGIVGAFAAMGLVNTVGASRIEDVSMIPGSIIGIIGVLFWMNARERRKHEALIAEELQPFAARVASHLGVSVEQLADDAQRLGGKYGWVAMHLRKFAQVYG